MTVPLGSDPKRTQMEQVSGQILSAVRNGILEIRISNVARHNALSMRMWEELAHVLAEASDDVSLRVVAITGDGNRAFAAGADISEFEQFRSHPELVQRFNAAVRSATCALASCPRPTVALVRGICMGGGMSIAQACDVRYCAEDARFRMPAGRLGIGYEPENIRHLAAVVGLARAAEFFFTGRTFFGRDAERMGYVQECFAVEDYAVLTAARVQAIAAMAPLTLRAFKLALRAAVGGPDAPNDEAVHAAFLACFDSADYQEGRLAFRQRREPRFKGW